MAKKTKTKERKLRIYAFGDNTGVGWYRIHSPMREVKRQKLADIRTSDFRWTLESEKIKFPSPDELLEIGYWADVILFQRHDTPQHMANILGMAEHFNIPVILDTDDNVEAVRPYNPGYRGYHPNSPATEFGKLAPKITAAITMTTDDLYRWHEKDNPHRCILPNSLDIRWRKKFKKTKHPKGEIHFGWLGSAAHYENLLLIRQAVVDILEKYPNATFHCMEMYGTSVWNPEDYPDSINNRIVRHPWQTLREWPKFIAELGLDFALAPAVDNYFNRAKSNLRYLEYSMAKTATIASPTECYSCIVDGKTGLHAKEEEDWFEAMDRLVQNPKLRKELAENAHKDLLKNYDMAKNAHMWVDFCQKTVDRWKKEHGPKKFFRLKDL